MTKRAPLPGDRAGYDTVVYPKGGWRGRMPPWPEAVQPVLTWWGLALPHSGHLVVIDPSISQQQAAAIVDDLSPGKHPRILRRFAFAASFIAASPAVAAALVLQIPGWTPLAVALCLVATFLLVGAIGSWKIFTKYQQRTGDGSRSVPAHVGAGLDESLYRLVRHLNSYRDASQDTQDSIRAFLAALADVDHLPADELTALCDEFSGWDRRSTESIRRAGARMWAELPRATSRGQWSWRDLHDLIAEESRRAK